MNVVEGLERIRQRLEVNQARPATLDAVEEFIDKARSAPTASARSLGQLVGLLLRSQAAHANTSIYDDLTRLEAELVDATAKLQAEREAADSRPAPKSTKYYKELKKKQRESK